MKTSAKGGDLPWADVFAYRAKQDSKRPIHVQVVEIEPGVPHVRTGDELFLHEITTHEISLKRYSTSPTTPDCSRSDDGLQGERKLSLPVVSPSTKEHLDDIEIVLPLEYNERFNLCRTFPLEHCFHSVQEILDTLPGVSKLIYPIEGFQVFGKTVREMERLEIVDQVQDPLTGSEMLSVHSMKTETQYFIPATMKISFVQLNSECYKYTPTGLTPLEFVRAWKPGQPAFVVKLCPTEEKVDSPLKKTKQKKDKKDKKSKHRSCDFGNIEISDLPSHSEDRWLIPTGWWDKKLLMKPFQKIRVKNIMFDAKDFSLSESAKLTVKIISADTMSVPNTRAVASAGNHRIRVLSAAEIFTGPLSKLPTELVTDSGDPLLLMVTAGKMSTFLRQKITAGSRLAVHGVRQSTKLLMTCSQSQRFLVSLSYGGTFKRLPVANQSSETSVKCFLNAMLPCEVQIIRGDTSLGYDQLAKRKELTVTEIISETMLVVDMFSPASQIISEQPFEIPLRRTNLSVQVLDSKSYNISQSLSLESARPLPAVEFVSESDIRELKTSMRKYSSDGPLSPEFPLATKIEPNRQVSRPNDIYASHVKKLQRANVPNHLDIVENPTPPPRPPKSPKFLNKEVVKLPDIKPPQIPPKPDRYKKPAGIYNYNTNNSNNGQLSGTAEVQNKKQILEEKRNSWRRRSSAKTLETMLEENQSILSAISTRHSLGTIAHELRNTIDLSSLGQSERLLQDEFTTTLQRPAKDDLTTFPKPVPKPRKPKVKNFPEMHALFNPNIATENVPSPVDNVSEERQINTEAADVGTYIPHVHPVAKESGMKDAMMTKLFAQKKKKTWGSMVNPNYAMRLGDDDIFDPAFDGNTSDGNEQVEPIYEFAGDVLPVREQIRSLTDDLDYEQMMSPSESEELPTPLEPKNDYFCTWEDIHATPTQTTISSADNSDYEVMDYEVYSSISHTCE